MLRHFHRLLFGRAQLSPWLANRRLRGELLEERALLAVAPLGSELLVNDPVIGQQTAFYSDQAIVSSPVNTIAVYSSRGVHDRDGVFASIYDLDGQLETEPFQVNSTMRGEQHLPTVGVDGNGNFVVAWTGRGVGDKEGIFFKRYNNQGIAQGTETLVNETIGGEQTEPTIAMAVDGSFSIAWSGVGAQTGQNDFDGVFLRRFNANGTPATGELRINDAVFDEQSEPSLALDSAGNLVAAWSSRHQDDSDWGIFGRQLSASTGQFGAEFMLSTAANESQQAPALAANPTGGVFAAWQSLGQDDESWDVVGRVFDNTASPTSAEISLNNDLSGIQQDVSVAVTVDGQLLAAWSTSIPDGSGWEVAARLFAADGTPDAASFPVNTATSGFASGDQRGPAITVQGSTASLLWSGNGELDHNGVFTQRLDIDVQDNGVQQRPDLILETFGPATVGIPFTFRVTATDANPFDTLTFMIDEDDTNVMVNLVQFDNYHADITFTPLANDPPGAATISVIVTDDGDEPLADSEEYVIQISAVT